MKVFKFYWLSGIVEVAKGDTIEQAFANAGYGAGALRALDWYEEMPYEEVEDVM